MTCSTIATRRKARRTLPSLLVGVWCLGVVMTTGCAMAEDVTPPGLIMGRGQDILAAKQKYLAGDTHYKAVVDELNRDAEKALREPITAVTQKDSARVADSGDPHDYVSLSPYWFPNPATANGLPYIRKDGRVNPDRTLYDQPRLDTLEETVTDLALAYYFTHDERYAENAAHRLRVWYFDPETRMNPNLNYAQFKPGHPGFNHYGVIESGRMRWFPDCAAMLQGSPHWTDTDDSALRQWFTQYLDWLVNSKTGVEEQASENNHGTWINVQIVLYAIYTGQNDLAVQFLKAIPARIDSQIEPDGSQPMELERTKGIDYCDFNIRAHLILARLGEHVGVDLWSYQSADGRSVRKALDYMIPYYVDPKTFPRKQITPAKFDTYTQTLRRASLGYKEPAYEQAITRMPNSLSKKNWFHLVLAPAHPGKAE